MTIQEVIERVDELYPNQYTSEQKKQWLLDFDAKVREENGPIPGPCLCGMEEDWSDEDHELMIPAPYAADIYTRYLFSRIAEANMETAKYNQYVVLLDDAYRAFASWLAKRFPGHVCGRWRF